MVEENNASNEFPKDFLWGTAIASHQVEGGNINDWSKGEKKFGLPKSGRAVDFYNLYERDFSLAKDFLHNNSIRLSIEWSRLQPEATKGFAQREVDHYVKLLEVAKNKGLSPMVTLHHFTNPVWFAEKGGWTKKDNIPYFTDYVAECKKQFGNTTNYWVTVNEPLVLTGMGYFMRKWPPKGNPLLLFKAYANLAKAHNESYKILTGEDKPIGSTNQMTDFRILPPVNRLLYTLMNHSFLDLTRSSNDYVGLNYYRPYGRTQRLPKSDFGWPIDARGLYNVGLSTWERYKLPIIITENGIADEKDTLRPKYIVDHLRVVKELIDKDVPIKGYYHWTLTDNYEWAEGYKMKFGLFSVNPQTLERVPRKSAEIYAKICKENRLPSKEA